MDTQSLGIPKVGHDDGPGKRADVLCQRADDGAATNSTCLLKTGISLERAHLHYTLPQLL